MFRIKVSTDGFSAFYDSNTMSQCK